MANLKQSLDQLLRFREIPRNRAQRFWLWINRISRNYALYFAQALKNFATKGQQEAAGFAYWAMFSMFPFFVLLLIVATSNQGHWSGRAQILSIADQMLPQVGSSVIQDALDNLPPNQHAFSLITALGLIFGSIRLFTNIQKTMSRIFRDERGRPWLVQTLIGLIMMITFGILMTVSTSLAALIALLRKQPTFRS